MSRTSACAKRNRSTPSSRTSPATCAGSTTSSRSSSSIAARRGQRRGVELAADHRGGAQHPDRLVGQPGQAPGDAPRRPPSAGRPRPAARRGRSGRPPAARTRRGRTGCRRSGRAARRACSGETSSSAHAGEDLGHGRARQPGQLEPHGVPPGRAPRRRRPARRSARGAAARSSSTSSRSSADGLDQQPQHPQRRGVRPVQVVEHHHGGLRRAAADADRPGDPLPRPELAGLPRPPSASGSASGRGLAAVEPGQHRVPRPQRRGAVVLRAAADQDAVPARPGQRRELRRPAGSCRCPAPRSARRTTGAPPRPPPGRPPAAASSSLAADHRPGRRPALGGGRVGPAVGGARPAGAGRGRGVDGARLGRDPVQRRVLAQHRGLEVAQLGRRLEPELLVEHLAQPAQHLERVGLPTGAGQRERPQRPQPLAQRVRRRQRLQLGGDGARAGPGRARRRPGPPARPARSSSSRARSATAAAASPSSAYGVPRQRPSASSRPLAGLGQLGAGERRRARAASRPQPVVLGASRPARRGGRRRPRRAPAARTRAPPSPAPSPAPGAAGPAPAPGAAARRRPAASR